MSKHHSIAFVPLDERPCNYEFPYLLARGTEFEVNRPPMEIMGLKKRPADVEKLWAWFEESCAEADGAVVALDTLLYGGIIPSRLHELQPEELTARLNRLRGIKQRYPALTLYAFQLIMRCPQYSLSDEEPDYYADWGREIFRTGFIGHRLELGIATEEEIRELAEIDIRLPGNVLEDYLGRRAVNIEASRQVLALVEEGIIEFMIVPQDDSAPYGHTAKDQEKIRSRISELDLELNVYMYPGADEVGCVLLTRMMNKAAGRVPLIYPRLSSVQGAFVIPLFEDRFFYETLKYQIMAAGGLLASSTEEADLVLLVNTPGETMMEAVSQQHSCHSYDVYRNVMELVEYGDYLLRSKGKPVAVADVGYANGGDRKLVKMLRRKGLLFELAGYAGWNTSSNSLGTVIAQAMIYLHYGRSQEHLDFLALRYAEDVCYCSVVRGELSEGPVQEMGYGKYLLDGPRGTVAARVEERLREELAQRIDTAAGAVIITDCYMPWNRMFEVGLSVRFEASGSGRVE
ncbi:hypothetical protein GCM10010912_27880 [Paenibacillus albidus]|uniref:DUF4127 family protein n=1 Tax=Paenibacillus albidus TaxID=2041023 RepID=A0A917FIL2_9BACL|nr:DUF4127 family protein [Paenibacillus albidus]GGF81197.1 hypothetical protein GCM10010912_27880 [Paenibacillus albidus]